MINALKSVEREKGKERLCSEHQWSGFHSCFSPILCIIFRRGCSLLGKLSQSHMKEALMLDLTFIFEVRILLPTLQIPNYQLHHGTQELNKAKYFTTFFSAPCSQLVNKKQSRLGYVLLLLCLTGLTLMGLCT